MRTFLCKTQKNGSAQKVDKQSFVIFGRFILSYILLLFIPTEILQLLLTKILRIVIILPILQLFIINQLPFAASCQISGSLLCFKSS